MSRPPGQRELRAAPVDLKVTYVKSGRADLGMWLGKSPSSQSGPAEVQKSSKLLARSAMSRACWAFMCGDDGRRCGVGVRSGVEFFLRAHRSGAPYCRHSGLDLR